MEKKQGVQIDERLVRDIASLARLDLTETEVGLFAAQFQDILDYVAILDEVDTVDVPPAYLASPSQSATREDEIEESVPTAEFLSNAPASKDDFVVIPRVHIEQ